MSAQVLLNLLTESMKSVDIRGLPSILLLFRKREKSQSEPLVRIQNIFTQIFHIKCTKTFSQACSDDSNHLIKMATEAKP